ncbi:Gfo/Idh/MocA family oxidoreductase [Cuneatibacter sp. NSJ-177]|uniref:Gfo/Idh/MocA family protein n=1 Tax=Cuneatibacter sp. NSJ-177 TaxID=2931401 RepID=UPI001FCF89A9|nr:Gfo/Idh/MocA family oxidoreductase [Cuneatibacter sp. NSJ-177]MCJ7835453.1 Gfo/Idh/MocA family oxidoreductase [Cuneatibacter sp. NSJ-177]
MKREIAVGTIGAGYAARLHGEAYRRVSGCDIRLKTIVDLDREKAEELQKTYGYEECLTDYHLMLEDPKIDVVDICAPPNLHVKMAREAFQAGKHVICEKPLTGYFGEPGDPEPIGLQVPKKKMLEKVLADMDQLREVWLASGKKFCYAENYVYASGVQKAMEIVEKKKSKILFLKGEESLKGSGSMNTGEWKQIGGGALIRAGCHPLSSLLALKQTEAVARGEEISVASVSADMGMASKCLTTDYEHRHIAARPHDVEDYANLSITFSDGTKASVLASDLVLGGTKGYVEVYTNDSAIHCRVSPVDVVSSYFLDEDRLEDVAVSEMLPSKTGWNHPFVADETLRGFLGEAQDFVGSIRTGREPFSGFPLAYETMKVIYAAYQSAEEGRRIFL